MPYNLCVQSEELTFSNIKLRQQTTHKQSMEQELLAEIVCLMNNFE